MTNLQPAYKGLLPLKVAKYKNVLDHVKKYVAENELKLFLK